MKLIAFIEKYGFLLVLLFCLGAFSPDFTSKVDSIKDLSMSLERQSSNDVIKQIFWISIFFFFTIRMFSESFYATFKKELGFCLGIGMAICFISLLSITWSLHPDVTFRRSFFQFIFFSAVALSCIFSFKHNTFAKSVELSSIIVIGLCFITIVTNTGFNESFALEGYTEGKNPLATKLLVLFALQIVSKKIFLLENRKSNILLYLVFFLLILTQSKTSIFIVFIYLLSINTLRDLSKPFVTFLFACCITLFIFLPSISYYLNNLWHVGLYLEDDALTGRGIIWDNLYYDMLFFSKIAFGYGYGSYFGVNQIPYFFDLEHSFLRTVTSAHNGYIGLFIQLGVIGCVYLFSVLLWVGKQFNHPLLILTLMIPIIHNITESSFYRDQSIIWLLFIILVCSVSLVRYGKIRVAQ